jgi:hypothetical protein
MPSRPCRSWLAALLLLGSCAPLQFAGDAGYMQMAVDGELALDATSGGGAGNLLQDVDVAFGLGDDRGSPYGRLLFDLGVPVLSVSAFAFSERGQGTLQADFGAIAAGTDVATDLDLWSVKSALAFEIDLGRVQLSPGVAAEYLDIDMLVRDDLGLTTEDLELQAPVPLLFLRGELDLDGLGVVAEIGYVDVPEIDDVEGSLLDLEALLEARLGGHVHLFAGYRYLDLDLDGSVDGQDFAADLVLSGWILGGGVRF